MIPLELEAIEAPSSRLVDGGWVLMNLQDAYAQRNIEGETLFLHKKKNEGKLSP